MGEWRQRNKAEYVLGFGGCCCICGYNRSTAALDFHHLDPNTKLFEVAGTYRTWAEIKKELHKCVCICANCHREFHVGLIEIPSDVRRFDESIVEQIKQSKLAERKEPRPKCKKCGMECKCLHHQFCSHKCASSGSQKHLNYPEMDVLVSLVKKFGFCGTARQISISDTSIRKHLLHNLGKEKFDLLFPSSRKHAPLV